VALAGWYKSLTRHPYKWIVCLVAKVGLGVQHISGGPEFIDWESKIDVRSSPGPRFQHKNIRKMQHTTHKGGSQEVSYVQKFNKQVGWPRKMAQQLLSVGLALSST
jgi:hypothetical protein